MAAAANRCGPLEIDTAKVTSAEDCPCTATSEVLLVDETYEKLAKCFISTGRGNRPRLPEGLQLTNRLFLQLKQLQREGQKTNATVNAWFAKLFPDVSYPSSRISDHIKSVEKNFLKLSGSDATTFLQQEQDMDFVSSALAHIGLNRKQLLAKEKPQMDSNVVVTHQHIVDLEIFRSKETLHANFVSLWLQHLLSSGDFGQCVKIVNNALSKNRSLSKNKGRASQFLSNSVTLPSEVAAPSSMISFHSDDTRRQCPEDHKLVKKMKKENNALIEENACRNKEIHVLRESLSEITQEKMKLESACATDHQSDLEGQLATLQNQHASLKLTSEKRRRQCNEANRKLLEQKNKFEQLLNERIEQLDKRWEKIQSLKSELVAERRQKEKLIRQVEDLTRVLQGGGNRLETRVRHENNRYSDDVRRTILNLKGQGNVSATRCSTVIKVVAKNLFDTVIDDSELPCVQTNCNIGSEGLVLSRVQTTEKMLNTTNCTLHLDGTQRDKKTLVGHQVTLDSGETLSFGYTSVACEDASTLVDITIQQLEEMCSLYADYSEQDKDVVFRQILEKITSFMTDRAAVMKKFDSVFLDFIRTQLGREVMVHFLYCNAHYLLGLSRVVEIEMCAIEADLILRSEGRKLGRDALGRFNYFKSSESATSRLIRTALDCTGPRGDEKSGCRQEWLAYCEQEGIKSLMTSFRTNRFNCVFQGAAAVVYHRETLRTFFPSLSHSNLKTQSVAADLEDDRLMVLLCAVGLVYLRITGPFWLLLKSKVQYTEQWQYINPLLNSMDRWMTDAHDLLDQQFAGVFKGEFELTDDPLHQHLYTIVSNPDVAAKVKHTLEQLMPKFFDVTSRQLEDFVSGSRYGGPPAEFPEGLEHCPLTNLLGENVFGDLDYDMGHRRNSSLHQRTSNHVVRHNRTDKWLTDKDLPEQTSLLKFARTKAPGLRETHRQQEKAVRLKLQEQRAENERKKLEKAVRLAEAKAAIIHRLRENGGPCETSADVDTLLHRLSNKRKNVWFEAVKDQIRYRKTVLGLVQLRMGGTYEEVVDRLKRHLDGDLPAAARAANAVPEMMEVDEDVGEQDPPPRAAEDVIVDTVEPFTFQRQTEWIAVYYDDQFYIGQVLEVLDKDTAVIKYTRRTRPNSNIFKFLHGAQEDISETSAHYVFRGDLDMNLMSNDGRMWCINESDLEDIEEGYSDIKGRQ